MDHHGFDAHFTAGALNAQGNFAAIGNKDFFKHSKWYVRR
ncbi:hypothetical protein CAter10_0809 [Collimonas arenae]|nr:hypothetical protein CAter10_0809 [Collimonas arenae]